jgi:WD repeat-containing protein 48
VLRYLFDNFIHEEIGRDENFRRSVLYQHYPHLATAERQRNLSPGTIQIPNPTITSWLDTSSAPNSSSTLRATNGYNPAVHTPGFGIGLATPAIPNSPVPAVPTHGLMPTTEERDEGSQRNSSERHSNDYFSARPPSQAASPVTPGGTQQIPLLQTALATPGSPGNGRTSQDQLNAGESTMTGTTLAAGAPLLVPQSPDAEQSATPEKSGLFGKKFMRGMNFMSKGKKNAQATDSKAAVPEEGISDAESRSSRNEERAQEDNFHSMLLRMHRAYEDQAAAEKHAAQQPASPDQHALVQHSSMLHPNQLPRGHLRAGSNILSPVPTLITPSLPHETPVLKPPPSTIVLIQVDQPDSGGVADLWGGSVSTSGHDADIIERVAPNWLFDVLLRNTLPHKEIVKVSFVLEPFENLLPTVSIEGNTRLNANRMLRARKILAYVAERIEPLPQQQEGEPPIELMRPEEYLELYCQGQVSGPNHILFHEMLLMTV